MPDLDFAGLRTDVEAAVRQPEFATLFGRSHRIRRWDRTMRGLLALIIFGALAPATLIGLNAAPGGNVADPDNRITPGPVQPEREPSNQPPAVTIHAIAGLRIAALYAAVDVCRPTTYAASCSLQVVPLGATAQDQRVPIVTGELRETPADPLSDVTLQMLSPQALLLAGIRRDGQLATRRISLGGGAAELAPEPSGNTEPARGDRLVQLRRHGELYYVRQADDRVYRTPTTPDLQDRTAVTGIAPENGWWVTGRDARTGQVAIAVSHDLGWSWTVRGLDAHSSITDAIVASADKQIAYAFVRTANGIEQRRTEDGGQSWQQLNATMPWPGFGTGDAVTRRLGAVVRADGSLLIWLDERPGTVFLESADRGLTYQPTSGPAGPVIAVIDGYVALGDPPMVSRDGHTWSPLPRPAIVSPD